MRKIYFQIYHWPEECHGNYLNCHLKLNTCTITWLIYKFNVIILCRIPYAKTPLRSFVNTPGIATLFCFLLVLSLIFAGWLLLPFFDSLSKKIPVTKSLRYTILRSSEICKTHKPFPLKTTPCSGLLFPVKIVRIPAMLNAVDAKKRRAENITKILKSWSQKVESCSGIDLFCKKIWARESLFFEWAMRWLAAQHNMSLIWNA